MAITSTANTLPIVVSIDRFVLAIEGSKLSLYNNGELFADHNPPAFVDDIGQWANARYDTLRIGYTDYGDGFEVISVYDSSDRYGFGYHWNLQDPSLSEWGDSALPVGDESMGDYIEREKEMIAHFREVMGDSFIQATPEPVRRIVAIPIR